MAIDVSTSALSMANTGLMILNRIIKLVAVNPSQKSVSAIKFFLIKLLTVILILFFLLQSRISRSKNQQNSIKEPLNSMKLKIFLMSFGFEITLVWFPVVD